MARSSISYPNNCRFGKQKTETGFHLCGVETHTRLRLLSFCSTAAEKTRAVFGNDIFDGLRRDGNAT